MIQRDKLRTMVAIAALCVAGGLQAADAAPKAADADAAVFARVNDSVISTDLYDQTLKLAFRNKYYHGKPPEGELEKLRREVGDTLIDRILLLAEARRRDIAPDEKATREALEAFEARYRKNPVWQKRRDELLPSVKRGLEEQDVLKQLEAAVRVTAAPSERQLRAYHGAHPDKFTEPERDHLSVILLKVDPGAPQAERDEAMKKARAIHAQLTAGADFAALARELSGDASASKGGDMGYVHRGMLQEALQKQIDKLKPGALSEPTAVLEGVAIIRLEARLPAKPKGFEETKQGVRGLWQREQAERQWSGLKTSLRKAATIVIVDRTRYPAVKDIKK